MRIKISERQLGLLLKEQDEPESKEKFTKWNAIGGRGDVYPVFSCVMYEPMTLKGDKIYPKNYPNYVEYVYVDDSVSGETKGISVTFHKKEPGGSDTKLWIEVIWFLGADGKKNRMMSLESVANTFKCGAEFSIEITTPDISSVIYYEKNSTTNEYEVCSSCSNSFSNLPTGTSFSSLKSFGDAIGKVEFDITTLTS